MTDTFYQGHYPEGDQTDVLFPGNIQHVPTYHDPRPEDEYEGYEIDDEILFSTKNYTQVGIVLALGQGVLKGGTLLGRRSSDKLWVAVRGFPSPPGAAIDADALYPGSPAIPAAGTDTEDDAYKTAVEGLSGSVPQVRGILRSTVNTGPRGTVQGSSIGGTPIRGKGIPANLVIQGIVKADKVAGYLPGTTAGPYQIGAHKGEYPTPPTFTLEHGNPGTADDLSVTVPVGFDVAISDLNGTVDRVLGFIKF